MTPFEGKRIVVMGLGRFGGGIGVARWLVASGADVLITDLCAAEDLEGPLAAIDPLVKNGRARLRLGEHNVSDFTTADLIVANPAVPRPWENRFLRSAEAAGVPITTEISLLVDRLPRRSRVIGITGTAGKSTTTAMIAAGLREVTGKQVVMGGNIGGSLLGSLEALTSEHWVVLELSSAMLYWLDRAARPNWRPHIAVVTNIQTNHVDWHGSPEHYVACKRLIIEQSTADSRQTVILGDSVGDWSAGGTVIRPGHFEFSLALPGAHNQQNAAMALAACMAACPHADRHQVASAIAGFKGLPHRLQLVGEGLPSHCRFYNDSKSTTPDATRRAVESLASTPSHERSLHLIVGGYDKGLDLMPLAELGARVGGLYAIGATAQAISSHAPKGTVHVCETLPSAVNAARLRMKPGDTLLLSPGCASWDQYDNYEQRGDEFIRLVRMPMVTSASPTAAGVGGRT